MRLALRRRAEFIKAATAVQPSLPELHRVYARRWGRIVGGAVGALLAGVWPFTFLVPGSGSSFPDHSLPAYWLVGASLSSIVAGLAAGSVARVLARARFQPAPAPSATGDEQVDLARLDEADPFASRSRALERLEAPSLALPLVTASLLSPLLLHLVVYALLCLASSSALSMADYSAWIGMSMVIVGHAHLALAVCGLLFARKLRRMQTEEILARACYSDWGAALGVATLVSALPGLILFAVPPCVAAATGLVVVPAMYHLARWRLLRERAVTDAARELRARVCVDMLDIEQTQDDLALAPFVDEEPGAGAQERHAQLVG